MATSKEEIKQFLLDNVEVHSQKLDLKGMQKEGATDTDDYLNSVKEDLQSEMFTQTEGTFSPRAAADFMPTILDPQLYDNGTLYGMTPLLTYLESKGRRSPAESTKLAFIKMTGAFGGEWLTSETADTQTNAAPTDTVGSASMCYLAVPVSLSDIIGKGASSTARTQLMEYAQQVLREEFDQTIVAGDAGTTGEFDGLFEIAKDTGNRTDMSNVEITEDDIEGLEVIMNDTLKTYPTFILTSASVLRQLKKDLASQTRVMDKTKAVLGLNIPAYASNRGEIPIVIDPYAPKTATTRRLGMFNENFINIADLIGPSYVQRGKTKPFATDGYLVQASVMYHTFPTGVAELYGIA